MMAPRTVGDLLTATAAALLRMARGGHRRRQTERALRSLSDAALKDIGIHRTEIGVITAALLAGCTVQPGSAR
jgi:uncharacterized protein YjiS (DUF1127 family)